MPEGEVVLWWGQPDPDVWLTREDRYLIPLGVLFTLFPIAMLILWLAIPSAKVSGFPVWTAAPFVLVGLYLAFLRLFVKRALKRRTVYVLTENWAAFATGSRDLGATERKNWTGIVEHSTDGQHITVTFGIFVEPRPWATKRALAPNTGLDFMDFFDRLPVAFYDVADVDGLTAALGRVGIGAPERLN